MPKYVTSWKKGCRSEDAGGVLNRRKEIEMKLITYLMVATTVNVIVGYAIFEYKTWRNK
jgi:hypothetical protein